MGTPWLIADSCGVDGRALNMQMVARQWLSQVIYSVPFRWSQPKRFQARWCFAGDRGRNRPWGVSDVSLDYQLCDYVFSCFYPWGDCSAGLLLYVYSIWLFMVALYVDALWCLVIAARTKSVLAGLWVASITSFVWACTS